MKTAKRIGRKMGLVQFYAQKPIAVIDVAYRVAPHGALGCGYATVHRAIKAGLVKYAPPLPGRRGMSVVAVDSE